MLAHKFKDKEHLVIFNENDSDPNKSYYGSRKLNGIRCFIFIVDGVISKFESRTGKPFKFFHHISNDIKTDGLYTSCILDGELFNPNIPFEVLCSLINSDEYVSVEYEGKTYTTDMLQFHCYDYINKENNVSYYNRFINNSFSDSFGSSVIKVENIRITTKDQIFEKTKQWMDEGYEGLMLRSGESLYEFGRRSISLLKVKLFESEEFQIKDIYLAENDKTKTMFILKNHHTSEFPYNIFDCSIKGNKEFNLQYYNNKRQYIGKWVTVSYQALSSYNVPLFAQIEAVREGEAVDGIFVPTT